MGYYVSLTNSDFLVPETPEVLQALRDLNKRDDLKTGGRWQGNKKTQVWFAWMPPDYDTDPAFDTAEKIFQELGFGTESDEDGFWLVAYDSKAGNEVHFVEAIAPFVRDGSFLEWRGEDDGMWRHEVKEGQLVSLYARIVWS